MEFSLKPITFFGRVVAIVCQNENGPCPLLALANILLLEGRITINPDRGIISLTELTQIVANCILEKVGTSTLPEHIKLLESVLNILPKLANGLDLNVIFSDVEKFEFTEEISVFDALNIRLLHGWIYDSNDIGVTTAIGNLSYNHLLFHLVEYKSLCEKRKQSIQPINVSKNLSEMVDVDVNSQDQVERDEKEQKLMEEGAVFEKFLETTAAQFTYPGMLSLYSTMHDRQFAVFFRNNHFSTLFFYNGQLFMLVTDLGYRHEGTVVWEVLDSIDGATEFYNAEFVPLSSLPPHTPDDYLHRFAPVDNVTKALTAEAEVDSNAVMSPVQISAIGHIGAAGGTFASPPSDAKYMYGNRTTVPAVSKTTSDIAVTTHQADGDPIHNATTSPAEESSTITAQSREREILDNPVTELLSPFAEADTTVAEGETPAVIASVEDIQAVNTDITAPSSVTVPHNSGLDNTTTPLPSNCVDNGIHPSIRLPDATVGADHPHASSVDADLLLAIQLQEQENSLITIENNNSNSSATIAATTVPSDHLHASVAVPARMSAMMTQEESDREHALRLHYEEMNALNRQQQQQNNASSTGRSHAYTTFAASQSAGFPYNQSREQQRNTVRPPRLRSGTASSGQKKDSCILS